MGSIFHIKNQWNILVIRNYYENWCTYSCLQIPPRENWFQYERRVYATAIDFPYIVTFGPLEDRSKSKIHMWRLGSIWWLPITNQKQWKMCTARFDGKPAELSETLHFFFIFCLLTHSRYPYFYPLDGVFIKFPLMQKVNHWKNSIFLICGVIQLTNWTMKIKKLNY